MMTRMTCGLVTWDTARPVSDVELRQALARLHSPVPTGPVQPNPYVEPTSKGGRLVCAGCGGVMFWPCLTRRIADGEAVDLTLPTVDGRTVGVCGVSSTNP